MPLRVWRGGTSRGRCGARLSLHLLHSKLKLIACKNSACNNQRVQHNRHCKRFFVHGWSALQL